MTRRLISLTLAAALVAGACSSDADDSVGAEPDPTTTTTAPDDDDGSTTTAAETATTTTVAPAITEDRAYYILPPGNFGGFPTTDESFDQLALYDGLTPLRGNVSDADIEELFLPADFEPIGDTTVEETGRPGTTIVYDEFGVAHITGETREDLAFGSGWVTARDRDLLISLGRGAARVAVADVPGIDAFGLVTTASQFVPSAATEQLVTDQVQLILDTYGDEGEEIIADAQAYADGMNAYWTSAGLDREPITVNDVIAVTAFIGSIFGAGGGSEAVNSEFLGTLQETLGEELGRQAWEDLMPGDDPEAPTTIEDRFDYPVLTGGDVTGSVVLDAGSLISLDPREPAEGSAPTILEEQVFYDAAMAPPHIEASNWLLIDPERSVNRTTLAVMGPQLGFYYPEIVMQVRLSGPGIEAQGAAVPGLAMYLLIGRTEDYAWSLTSANQDVRDVYAEVLCEPDGGTPTRETSHYRFDGECVPFELFDAGTLNNRPIRYPVSVHGPVIGTALVDGEPVALTRKRSTFGRDGLNLAALKSMTEGDAATVETFWESANRFGFTFNWGYANREGIGYFASGYLPERTPGLDRRLPTLGTGEYEWQGFLDQAEHPHADGHPSGRLLNWNNQSAPGFMHGDGNQYGSWHRVENFDQWPADAELRDVVGVMNRAATEDTRAPVWPVISEVLRSGEPVSPIAGEVVDLLDAWAADDAPRLDADDDGDHDRPGPLVLDEVWDPIVDAVLSPVYGDALDTIDLRGIDSASLLDKDLRTVVGAEVEGPFNIAYCGGGDLVACSDSIWDAIDTTAARLVAELGDDTSQWLSEGLRLDFAPGLIPETFRATNRPTFQQVLEFAPQG
ncbi:MAG: hypothetical protein EX269_14390 [Acidimicrobiales bacterium]|nr:MAG: hypothetical protein EX269_14390 [Acidimicrobiales bacterium]